jgi:hypothetical protein
MSFHFVEGKDVVIIVVVWDDIKDQGGMSDSLEHCGCENSAVETMTFHVTKNRERTSVTHLFAVFDPIEKRLYLHGTGKAGDAPSFRFCQTGFKLVRVHSWIHEVSVEKASFTMDLSEMKDDLLCLLGENYLFRLDKIPIRDLN